MIEGLWLVLRAAGLVLALQAAGGALCAALLAWRQLAHVTPAIRRLVLRTALAALALLAAQALFEPVHLAGESSGFADAALWRLLLGSSTAVAMLVRGAGLACVALGLRLRAGGSSPVALAGSLATLSSFLFTGHTAAHPLRPWLALLLLVHVTIVAFWLGSLWPLRQLTLLEPRALATRALEAFSAVALWAVPVIALAGAGMAVMLLPDVAALTRPYGLLLIGKLTLFTLLMALAALNRLRLTPALARGVAQAPAQLRRSIALEYALICATLALTAVMTGSFSPAERAAGG